MAKTNNSKYKLVKELKREMIEDQLNWSNFIWELVEESLMAKSEEELNELLYAEQV